MGPASQRKSTFTDGERYFKASSADHGTKIDVIRNNAHKYSVSAMCSVLNLPKSTYYYHANLSRKSGLQMEDQELTKEIARIFKESRNNYGTRKIKKELARLLEPKQVSQRRIGRLMKGLGLVSNYTVAQFKPHKSMCNEAPVKNELQRQFNQDKPLAVIVSDLTYVRVGKKMELRMLICRSF